MLFRSTSHGTHPGRPHASAAVLTERGLIARRVWSAEEEADPALRCCWGGQVGAGSETDRIIGASFVATMLEAWCIEAMEEVLT